MAQIKPQKYIGPKFKGYKSIGALLNAIGRSYTKIFKNVILNNYKDMGDGLSPYGYTWKPIKDTTIKRKQALGRMYPFKIGYDSGYLYNNIFAIYDLPKKEIRILVNTDYAEHFDQNRRIFPTEQEFSTTAEYKEFKNTLKESTEETLKNAMRQAFKTKYTNPRF